jgi:hypothetical protein
MEAENQTNREAAGISFLELTHYQSGRHDL